MIAASLWAATNLSSISKFSIQEIDRGFVMLDKNQQMQVLLDLIGYKANTSALNFTLDITQSSISLDLFHKCLLVRMLLDNNKIYWKYGGRRNQEFHGLIQNPSWADFLALTHLDNKLSSEHLCGETTISEKRARRHTLYFCLVTMLETMCFQDL